MCAARVRPEHPERLVHQDAACASGRTFFFLMKQFGVTFSTDSTEQKPVGIRANARYLGTEI